jgi:cytochrome oxidase Cu insertion factor (SCO1/SenC/PrrC family)
MAIFYRALDGRTHTAADSFGQDVRVETDAAGRPTRAINHMLKLFLIDSSGVVREIYSLAFLHPEVMLNDIQTLLMEPDPADPNA